MILVDFSGTIHAAVAVALKESCSTTTDIGYLRHLILSQLHSLKVKYGEKYGELVICLDSPHCWRKDVFPYYKAKRAESRKASEIDWNTIFGHINTIIQEFKENLPYRIIAIPELEGDDIIAILSKKAEELTETNILGEMKYPVLIVSNDKDMKQLHQLNYVKQYTPRSGLISKEKDASRYLTELVLKGDTADGVPNIRSEDDTFLVQGKRQKPVTQKYIKEFLENGKYSLSSDDLKRYERNIQLISFDSIPHKYFEQVIAEYNKPVSNSKMKIFKYFASVGLNKMLDVVNDF